MNLGKGNICKLYTCKYKYTKYMINSTQCQCNISHNEINSIGKYHIYNKTVHHCGSRGHALFPNCHHLSVWDRNLTLHGTHPLIIHGCDRKYNYAWWVADSREFPFLSCAPTRFVPRWHSIASPPETPCADMHAQNKGVASLYMREITYKMECYT